MMSSSKIAIVGTGQVGGAAAYALIFSSVASELLLVDIEVDVRDGQVQDLSDVAYSCNSATRVRTATYREASHCDIVVITAGSKHSLGQTTLDYTYHNISIVQTIIDAMRPFGPETILLIVASPVDLLTSLAWEISRLPASRVLGSGTFLDSVRLQGLIADEAGISANSIDISVLGVQGDSQVVAWSNATVDGLPIDESLASKPRLDRVELEKACRHRSQMIARAKGASPFGIGSIVARISSSILMDKCHVLPVSHLHPDFGCCFSLPAMIGRKGVVRTIQMPLDKGEEAKISESAKYLKGMIDRVRQESRVELSLNTLQESDGLSTGSRLSD